MRIILCHASQIGGHQYLLTGLGEGLNAFMQDTNRMGRSSDIALMMFSESILNGDYAPLPIFG